MKIKNIFNSSILPSHRIAFKILKENRPITHKDVNKVLSFSGIKINKLELDKMIRKSRLHFNDLNSETIKSEHFIKNVGTYRGKIQIPGVYIWTHKVTGDKYVGSSSALARRLIGYFKGTHKNTGKFIPLIKKEGLEAFNLEIITLTESYSVNQELSLEQYFLLHPEFTLNTLKVVNNFSGGRSKSLYMYTEDLKELIYSSDIQEDFIFKLGIHYSTFTKSLKTGSSYLDKYVFTDKPVLTAVDKNLTLTELNVMLTKDREDAIKAYSRKVVVRPEDNLEDIQKFDSIKDTVKFLKTKGPSNKTTLYRHIKSGKSYHGFICEWDIDNFFEH